jgi:hypothetical protein
MALTTSLLLLALGALNCLGFASSYTCYNCNDVTGPACPNPFNPSGVGTCQGDTCGLATDIVSGVKLYIRACSAYVANGCTTVQVAGEPITGCACNSDYCNSAPARHGSETLGFFALLALFAVLATALMRG